MDFSPPITIPPTEPHTHTLIFLHGRGDTAQNFLRSIPYSTNTKNQSFPQLFPSFRWVFPQARLTNPSAFPRDKISQWFDIWNVQDFSDHEDLQAMGLRESVMYVRRVIEEEVALLGECWEKVVLAGISQGAATAVHTLLNLNIPSSNLSKTAGEEKQVSERRIGAFMGFSCRMPFPGRTLVETRNVLGLEDVPGADDDEVLRNTPVLLEHCVDDPLVLVVNGRILRDTLMGFGVGVTWKEYPDGGHWFNSPRGIDDAVEFLNRHVLGIPGNGGERLSRVRVSPDAMDLS